jgi:(1->4)-alpha-D-glucan 1-alpha-D-glucosylmutase
MLGTTTHDTKRTADVRSRLDVLSEIPEVWGDRMARWRRMNRGHQRMVGGRRVPDTNTLWLLYQTVVGVWPPEALAPGAPEVPDAACLESLRERVDAYMLKAVREAKVQTSWTEPDEEFEAAVSAYVAAILSPGTGDDFLRDLHAFLRLIARPGLWNALARALLHLTAPGVPDVYQGDETWNFALVDPDNRRPVDYDRRRAALDELVARFARAEDRAALLGELVAAPEDGRVKLQLVHRALGARRRHPAIFVGGGYEPLEVAGPAAAHVVAFARRGEGGAAITMVPRLLATLLPDADASPVDPSRWEGTAVRLPGDLAGAAWTCELAGHSVRASDGALAVADCFRHLPAALLVTAV